MSDTTHETQEILATREAMKQAGWRCAVDSLPGAYVPCAGSTGITKPSDWIVDVIEVLEEFQESCDDPEFLAGIKAKLARR